MFSGGGDMDRFAAAGIPAEILELSVGSSSVGVYPDNWQTARIFSDMITQWRAGASGPIGLDYSVLPVVFRLRGVRMAERAEIFDGLQVMESSALKTMRDAHE